MENTTPATTTTPGSGSKKTVWIIIAIVLLVFIGGGIVMTKVIGKFGGKVVEKALERSTGGDADISYGENASLPKDWPSDLPQYPGSTLVFGGSTKDENGKAVAAIILTTSDTPETIISYYRKEATEGGWTILESGNANGALTLIMEKGSRQAFVAAASEGGQTGITVSVGEK